MAARPILNRIPDATLFGSIILSYILNLLVPVVAIIPSPVNLVGWVTVTIGVILIAYTISYIRSRRASTDVTGASHVLLMDDLFARSRNPLYLAYILVTLGMACVFGSLSSFIPPVLCFLVLNFYIIPFEETQLHKAFGKAYDTYRHHVRRWL